MKILITGASGYVGRILTQYFSHNHQVFAAARDSSKITIKTVQRHTLDVLVPQQIQRSIERTAPDLVIHAAALPKRSAASEEEFVQTNVDGAAHVAHMTEHYSDAKFIMISSGCAFEQTLGHKITLNSPRSSASAFARSKNLAEIEVRQAFKSAPQRLAIVYPPVILHPSQTEGIIPSSLKDAVSKGILTNRVTDGHVNFVHHARFARLLEAIACHKSSSTTQQYLLTGTRFTTDEFFGKLQRLFAELTIPSAIRRIVDCHYETMCEADEHQLSQDFPHFEWGTIDDVVKEIARNNAKLLVAPPAYSATARMLSRLEQPALMPSWIPGDKTKQMALDKMLALQEQQVLTAAGEDGAQMFLEIRHQMKSAQRSDGDFFYPIFEPVLKRLILNLVIKFKAELAKAKSPLRRLMDEGLYLLADKIPYKKTMIFVAKLLQEIDALFLIKHPSLTSSFHKQNAEHVLEKLLSCAPDVLLFPSFQEVDIDYFLRTRPTPFHIVGITFSGIEPGEALPFADGFAMKPSEFYWHDIGHIEFMQNRDQAFIEQSFKPLERIISEWNFTRRRITSYLTSISSQTNLLDATKLILFELLHERGFQYSLVVLKAELDTPKWTEILNRKFTNNYYRNSPEINLALFGELETARVQLLHFAELTRCQDQRKYIEAMHGAHLALRITNFPRVNYGQGFLHQVVFHASKTCVVLVKDDKYTTCDVSELILAQINPTTKSPFDLETRRHIMQLLTNNEVHSITLDAWKNISVLLKSGRTIALDDYIPQSSNNDISSQNRHFFELEQVLGSLERGEIISYTQQEATKVYIGTIHHLLDDRYVTIRNKNQTMDLELARVLVDPLQKEDFAAQLTDKPNSSLSRLF